MRIACLHTHPINIALFDAACPVGMVLHHTVRADLLERGMHGLDADLTAEVQAQMATLATSADRVLLTCSMLRPAAVAPYQSADGLLARHLDQRLGDAPFTIFLTNPATCGAAEQLFAKPLQTGQAVLHLIAGAWSHLLAGETDRYIDTIRRAIGQSPAETIVLAQSSMAPAATDSPRRIITVPEATLAEITRPI